MTIEGSMTIGYVHIYVNGEHKRNWRYFQDTLPKVGTEIVFDHDTIDIRYLINSIELVEKFDHGDLYRFHCNDLSKEKHTVLKPKKTYIGNFHDLDRHVMKMFPEYTKNDWEYLTQDHKRD